MNEPSGPHDGSRSDLTQAVPETEHTQPARHRLPGAATQRPAEVLGRYELLDQVGEGGMGVVYRAKGPDGRYVALKALRPYIAHDPDARARLRREVGSLRRVRAPGVAALLDADVDGPRPYLVTEFVSGAPLDKIVANEGAFSGQRLADLATGLADALRSIHLAGVIHRDLKPGNVLISRDGPVLIDFGISHVAEDSRLTMTGLVMGTPGYLSPEMVEGGDVTQAADWWGWAATLAYAASGTPPFGRGQMTAVLDRVLRGQADLTGVDERIRPLLAAALSPDPRARPGADRVLHELQVYAAGGYTTGLPIAGTAGAAGFAGASGAGGAGAGSAAAVGAAAGWAAAGSVAGGAPAGAVLPHAPATPTTQPIGPSATARMPQSIPPQTSPQTGPQTGGPSGAAGWNGAGSNGAGSNGAGSNGAAAFGARPGVAVGGAAYPAGGGYTAGGYWDVAQPAPSARPGQPGQPGQLREPTPASATTDPRIGRSARTGTLTALLFGVVTLSAVLPVVAWGLLLAWVFAARWVDRAMTAVVVRRFEGGRRSTDPLVAAAFAPWHAFVALIATAFGAILPAIVALAGAVAVALGVAVAQGSGQPSLGTPLPIAVGVLLATVLSWWGPGGRSLRRGSRSIVRVIAPGSGPAKLAVAVILVASVGCAFSAMTHWQRPPSWWPYHSVEQVPGADLIPTLPSVR